MSGSPTLVLLGNGRAVSDKVATLPGATVLLVLSNEGANGDKVAGEGIAAHSGISPSLLLPSPGGDNVRVRVSSGDRAGKKMGVVLPGSLLWG